MLNDQETYPLHKAAFLNNTQAIAQMIEAGIDIYEKDLHGNTALHISTILGHRETTALLLAHNAPVKVKNCDGWNCLQEAISYGDRQIITSMLRKLKDQSKEKMSMSKPNLCKVLEELDDFYLEFKWNFNSWIPFVSKVLPSDTCRVFKKGSYLRLNTTLVDFNDRNWERGDISFIINPNSKKIENEIIILDNKSKVFQRIRKIESDAELDEEIDVLMSSDIMSAQASSKPIKFVRATEGWIFKKDKSSIIGEYDVDYYLIEGLSLVSRKRREHLTQEDIKNNKAFFRQLTSGHITSNDDDFRNLQHRKSLPPPGRTSTTWEEYIGSAAGCPPPLGRPQVFKENTKIVKASVGMSETFPIDINILIKILELLSSVKHFDKLRRFIDHRLPPGFPVHIELPLLPTISANISFKNFQFRNDLIDSMFCIPKNYREDPTRFPDL
uniref:ANK_REP_REGION domain-containing protein n=1 Tax=Rhabditophanes sp. KR3021 TaxID=114890 RepID=A0AC35U868_9BILA